MSSKPHIAKTWNKRIRCEALAHYGGRCACCGEDREIFLCIDHIAGDGGQQNKELRKALARTLMVAGWPDGYQILCFNCNVAKGRGLECPCPKDSLTVNERLASLGPLGQVRGERQHMAKLTADAVRSIREHYAAGSGTLTTLAREHGVTPANIQKIVQRHSWRHVA